MPTFCGKKMTEYVARGFSYREVTVRCGSTSPTGYPYQCEECAKANAGVNWELEAAMNGERISDDY